MNTPQITMKTSQEAHRLLRIIAATTGEKQYQVLERLLRAEFMAMQKRVRTQGKGL